MTDNNQKILNPFRVIRRGEDTLGADGENVVFSDFSPRVMSADQPELEVEVTVPKEGSAPEPAPSSESKEVIEPKRSETPAPAPADEGAGKPSLTVPGKLTSSSPKKSG